MSCLKLAGQVKVTDVDFDHARKWKSTREVLQNNIKTDMHLETLVKGNLRPRGQKESFKQKQFAASWRQ